jgi:hypothetical protein
MWKDPIVEKIRKNREKIFARFDYDVKKFSAFLMVQQKKSGRKIVTLEEMRKKTNTENQTS